MKDLYFEFVDLENDHCFQGLGKTLGGSLNNGTLTFENDIAKGEILRKSFNEGLVICKWKLNAFQPITIRKKPAAGSEPKKLTLLYILTSSNLFVRNAKKKIRIHGSRNNLFWTNASEMDFHIHPKQPFYL